MYHIKIIFELQSIDFVNSKVAPTLFLYNYHFDIKWQNIK